MGKAFIQSEKKLIGRKEESSASHSKSPDVKRRKRSKMTIVRTFELSRFSDEVLSEAYGRLLPIDCIVVSRLGNSAEPQERSGSGMAESILL